MDSHMINRYVDLENGCCSTKRRIDLRKLINNTMLCLEVDGHQHKYYVTSDENNRYDIVQINILINIIRVRIYFSQ